MDARKNNTENNTRKRVYSIKEKMKGASGSHIEEMGVETDFTKKRINELLNKYFQQ